jgi:hypothetical protein
VRRLLRRHTPALACLALAGAIGVAAIVDHRWKQARIDRAELSEWYCSHEGTRCGGPSSSGIEARWNERQLGYEVAVVTLAAAATALALRRSRA